MTSPSPHPHQPGSQGNRELVPAPDIHKNVPVELFAPLHPAFWRFYPDGRMEGPLPDAWFHTTGGHGRGEQGNQDAFWPAPRLHQRTAGQYDQKLLSKEIKAGEKLLVQLQAAPIEYAFLGRLYVVADGVSGCDDGRLASHLAVNAIGRFYYEKALQSQLHIEDEAQRLEYLRRAILDADRRLVENDMTLQCTCVCALIQGRRLHIASVGDSRAYHVGHRDDRVQVRRLTRDDEDPQGRLSLALGIGLNEESVQIYTVDLAPGDQVLLCTDGLYRYLSPDPRDENILIQTLSRPRPPAEHVRVLATMVYRRWSEQERDDLTLGIVPYTPDIEDLREQYVRLEFQLQGASAEERETLQRMAIQVAVQAAIWDPQANLVEREPLWRTLFRLYEERLAIQKAQNRLDPALERKYADYQRRLRPSAHGSVPAVSSRIFTTPLESPDSFSSKEGREWPELPSREPHPPTPSDRPQRPLPLPVSYPPQEASSLPSRYTKDAPLSEEIPIKSPDFSHGFEGKEKIAAESVSSGYFYRGVSIPKGRDDSGPRRWLGKHVNEIRGNGEWWWTRLKGVGLSLLVILAIMGIVLIGAMFWGRERGEIDQRGLERPATGTTAPSAGVPSATATIPVGADGKTPIPEATVQGVFPHPFTATSTTTLTSTPESLPLDGLRGPVSPGNGGDLPSATATASTGAVGETRSITTPFTTTSPLFVALKPSSPTFSTSILGLLDIYEEEKVQWSNGSFALNVKTALDANTAVTASVYIEFDPCPGSDSPCELNLGSRTSRVTSGRELPVKLTALPNPDLTRKLPRSPQDPLPRLSKIKIEMIGSPEIYDINPTNKLTVRPCVPVQVTGEGVGLFAGPREETSLSPALPIQSRLCVTQILRCEEENEPEPKLLLYAFVLGDYLPEGLPGEGWLKVPDAEPYRSWFGFLPLYQTPTAADNPPWSCTLPRAPSQGSP